MLKLLGGMGGGMEGPSKANENSIMGSIHPIEAHTSVRNGYIGNCM